MKFSKLLAVATLSVALFSCDNCEDVNLGKLEFTNELIAFLPAEPAQDKSYYVMFEGTRRPLNYLDENSTVTIPVNKINYSGKFDANYCKEYYTAQQKIYSTQVAGGSPVSINIIYKKDASEEQYNTNLNKDNVGDLIVFQIELNNVFPEPVAYGTTTIDSFKSQRSFLLDDATTATIDDLTHIQEFLPTVTLNGVEYENVYHLYIKQPHLEAYEPRSEKYPLDYIKEIYIKEGMGVVQAYTAKGKQVSVTIE